MTDFLAPLRATHKARGEASRSSPNSTYVPLFLLNGYPTKSPNRQDQRIQMGVDSFLIAVPGIRPVKN